MILFSCAKMCKVPSATLDRRLSFRLPLWVPLLLDPRLFVCLALRPLRQKGRRGTEPRPSKGTLGTFPGSFFWCVSLLSLIYKFYLTPFSCSPRVPGCLSSGLPPLPLRSFEELLSQRFRVPCYLFPTHRFDSRSYQGGPRTPWYSGRGSWKALHVCRLSFIS